MGTLDFKNFGLQEMSAEEMKATEGGFLVLLALAIPYVFQAALVGSLVSGIYASFKSGYNSVQ
jgi:lactobin A/cerein 7B family class IIb bacteriocin